MFELYKDEQKYFEGTEIECLRKLQKGFPASFKHALKHEGFKIKKVTTAEACKKNKNK